MKYITATLICVCLYSTLSSVSIASETQRSAGHDRMPASSALSAKQLKEAQQLLERIQYNLETPPPAQQRTHKTETATTEKTPHPAATQESSITPLQISYETDLALSCPELSKEANLMHEIITTTEDIKNDAKLTSHSITAAGAVGSFLIGSVTGGVGLAVGGFLLDQNMKSSANNADETQDIAEQRRTLMLGIYNAKGCKGPLIEAHNFNNTARTQKLSAIEPTSGTQTPPFFND